MLESLRRNKVITDELFLHPAGTQPSKKMNTGRQCSSLPRGRDGCT